MSEVLGWISFALFLAFVAAPVCIGAVTFLRIFGGGDVL